MSSILYVVPCRDLTAGVGLRPPVQLRDDRLEPLGTPGSRVTVHSTYMSSILYVYCTLQGPWGKGATPPARVDAC